MKDVMIKNCNYLRLLKKREESPISFPSEIESENITTHVLFKSSTMRKLFEGFDLDLLLLTSEQSGLLDRIYLYLLKGGQGDLKELLPIITLEHRDLWISLHGARILIAQYQMKNLFQLDVYLEDAGKRMVKRLTRARRCD